MEIVTIFAESLYAVRYEGEISAEYHRLIELWTDQLYLHEFAKQAAVPDIGLFKEQVVEDAYDIDDLIYAEAEGKERLASFFQPLHNQEMGFVRLSLQKGKPNRKSYLRIYALRIDANIYLITGGGIKVVRAMQDSEELMQELTKLKEVKNYLVDNHVFDKDSFQDFKTEQDEN